MTDLLEFLRGNSYPGRGIVVGKNCVYYFIMGRSENSRNRIFTETSDGIRTEAYDSSKMQDPSLIIYHPVREYKGTLIVSNGDQTDTIREGLRAGIDARQALRSREYEPDEPNYTPRISAVIEADGSFEISILKRSEGRCLRAYFDYEGCEEGSGYFISTYMHDGNPLPSFEGEPIAVKLPKPEELWAALDADNKISLYANASGKIRLFNKHLGD